MVVRLETLCDLVRSLSEYIPLVASDPRLIYFQVDLVIDLSTTGGKVSTVRSVNRYHESPRRYMVDVNYKSFAFLVASG